MGIFGNNKKKILIVDDEPSARFLAVEVLSEDYNVEEADGGVEALEKISADKPDLVLLDLVMPDMNGKQVLTTLRASSSTQALPVLMVTAMGQLETVDELLSAGATDYLTKPIDIKKLKAKVDSLLQG
jgi:DNA-binding response OmpR family regulator